MSQTGLKVFDRTVQESNEWLGELEEDLHAEDRRRAYIMAGEIQDVTASLPQGLRELWADQAL